MGSKQSEEFLEFSQHFPTEYGSEIMDYVTNDVLLDSRYIFTRRVAGVQFGHCTHCKKNFPSGGLKHNSNTRCPECNSYCIVKASGKGRKYMIDRAYVVYYEKSLTDPQAVVARGFSVTRDYSKDYLTVETAYTPHVMYLFKMGGSQMFWCSYYGAWRKEDTVKSIFSSSEHANDWCSFNSIREAIEGTPFQYSTWDSYQDKDMVKFFYLYSKYPCIEYLTKLDMEGVVWAKLSGQKTYGMINWRAKNPLKVLKMTKHEINELRATDAQIDPWLLYLRSIAKKDGSNISMASLAQIGDQITERCDRYLKEILVHTTLRKASAYLNKQLGKPEIRKRYSDHRQLLLTWTDYLDDAIKLKLDLSQEVVLFPSNLYQAHQNTIKQIKVKEDEAIRAKFASRSKALAKYRFEALGFLIRPAVDQAELIEEGTALQHCVGTYAARYARGDTDLFVLRKLDEPDKPFYTMEIRNGSISQCRGLKNCSMTDEVKEFVDLFVSRKLLTKKQTRTEVTALDQNRQEVAV